MKRKFKIAGVIALVLTLVFNLQYALLNYDVANNPSLAYAAFTSNGTVYCGTQGTPYPTLVGTWIWQPPDDEHTGGGYEDGYYIFYVYGGGNQCGAHSGDETDIIPTGSGYQY